jgi:hypothetical protein
MAESGSDKRRHARRKVLKGAKVFFNEGKSVYDCTARDWSESGARLVFPELTLLPKFFILHLSDGSDYICKVVRVDGTVVGVKFVDK